LRPRPGRTFTDAFKPSASNLSRQRVTVAGDTEISCAILVVAKPSAAINSAVARCTSRCAAVCDRDNVSSTSR
jgi:hypothetical protein